MSGDVYERKRVCKAQYRRCLRHRQRNTGLEISNDLHDCLIQKNGSDFWKSWNSKFKKRRSQCVIVNGLNSHADIANAFADNFATVCQHNSISHNESLKREFHDKFPAYCKTFANGGCLLSSDQVELSIAKLKTGKAPGVDLSLIHISEPTRD